MNDLEKKEEAIAELRVFLSQLEEIGENIRHVIHENFPENIDRMDAYRMFDFTGSNNGNPYTQTLIKEVDTLENTLRGYDD